MKTLQKEFQTNADGAGLQTFKQLKRKGNVALYERIRKDGGVHSYEAFLIKIVKAGTTFVKGGVPVEEDYESYPGKSSFGKWAWSCKTLARGEARFEELVKNQDALLAMALKENEGEDSEGIDKSKTVGQDGAAKGKRGRKAKVVKMPIPRKGEKFTMKNLMAWSGEAQPLLYIRLKPLVENGMVSIVGEVREASTRGKAQVLYMSNTDSFATN